MRDIELYRAILGIDAPWTVGEVKLNLEEKRVDVVVTHDEGLLWPCPECALNLPLYDHSQIRTWRHLDSCAFQTFLHARPPRVDCPEHGVKQVKLAWAEARSRFTALFERLAIDIMLETDITGAAKILDLSWDEAWGIQERAVARGLRAKENTIPKRIGVDEKAIAKGHRYLTLVCNHDNGCVEYIADGRTTSSLAGYFQGLTEAQREGIEAVAMDMWEPFINAAKAHLKDADEKIVFDKYHIMSHAGEAVDKVRREEHQALLAENDNTLSKSKYLWLYREENIPQKDRFRFRDLKEANLKTAKAWAIKESLGDILDYKRRATAVDAINSWYGWAVRSKLKPVVKLAYMVRDHLRNILTYFTHRITNAVCEGINSKIQTIKKMAYGFRNTSHFKTAIFFHCGGLSLYPSTHAKP